MIELNGKTALITGGASGIGLGLAHAFVEAGMKVVLADVDFDLARAEADAIGADAMAVSLDVTSRVNWATAKSQAETRFGPVEVLCNNAGISTPRMPLEEMPEDLFEKVLAVNLGGVHNGIAAFAGEMKARGSGHIVNTSSVNGLIPFGSYATYSASKFGVTGLSEALHQELTPCGVGVSILYPGLTRSRMALSPEVGAGGGNPIPPEVEAMMMEPIWLGRATVAAIKAGELHIISHPHFLPGLEARLTVLRGAFGEPAQPGYAGGSTARVRQADASGETAQS